MPSANRLLNAINQIRSGIPATKLIIDEFKKNSLSITSINQDIDFKNSITLKNISFQYKNTTKTVIDNINLTIRKGSCIGFVGKRNWKKHINRFINRIGSFLPHQESLVLMIM